jgi:hypothetical protein
MTESGKECTADFQWQMMLSYPAHLLRISGICSKSAGFLYDGYYLLVIRFKMKRNQQIRIALTGIFFLVGMLLALRTETSAKEKPEVFVQLGHCRSRKVRYMRM